MESEASTRDEKGAEEVGEVCGRPVSISEEISRFVRQVDGLGTSLPLLMVLLDKIGESTIDEYNSFLSEHGETLEEEDGVESFRISSGDVTQAAELRRRCERTDVVYRLLPRSFVVSLVSQYDSFIGRLLRCLFAIRPEKLKKSENSLSYAQLTTFDSMEAATDFVADREVDELLRESHITQIDEIQKLFDITVKRDIPIWGTFVEVTERRNLFTHCDGVVSQQYLNNCRANGVTFESAPSLGGELTVSPDYFKRARTCILEFGVQLGHVLWRKQQSSEIAAADSNLNELCYELISEARYETALALLDFAVNVLPPRSSDEARRMFAINLAQAHKWLGDGAASASTLDSLDWSATDLRFRLAVAVLRDDFTTAASLMKEVGAEGPISKHDYTVWPLFREFRESDDFLGAFKVVFGEAFAELQEKMAVIEEVDPPN